ncbi:hypothetical protein EG329_005744 [Mollisiaceae sp. DMI_Dod_QoI]|nr:hypothetical protein EG329_005744 [Helotiales sp. DMI_Dod_QoI]
MASFTLFPNLPQEIKDKIWEFAVPQSPRVVEVYSTKTMVKAKTHSGQEPGQEPEEIANFSTTFRTEAVALLSVCQDSRAVALRCFPLRFSSHLGGCPVNLNYETDVFYLRDWDTMELFSKTTIRRLYFCSLSQSVSTEGAEFEAFMSGVHHLVLIREVHDYLSEFQELKSVVFPTRRHGHIRYNSAVSWSKRFLKRRWVARGRKIEDFPSVVVLKKPDEIREMVAAGGDIFGSASE